MKCRARFPCNHKGIAQGAPQRPREQSLDIAAMSGILRVTVTPRPAWIGLLVEAVGIVVFGVYIPNAWASLALWERVFLTFE
jgi:hypothetical protein